MKKTLISLNLIFLTYFCTINLVCCAEEFFLDSEFNVNNIQDSTKEFSSLESKMQENYEALQKRLDDYQKTKEQTQTNNQINNQTQNNFKTQTKESNAALTPFDSEETAVSFKKPNSAISKLFSPIKDKLEDRKQQKAQAQNGYYGELPDISRDFKYKKPSSPVSREKDYRIPTLEELNSEIAKEKLKLAPVDDPLFIDNILKKQDTKSEYLKDIQKTKFALNNLKKCIEENGNIQKFNACVNVINLQVTNLEEKYKNKPENLKESFRNILSVNYHSKVLGNLLYDSNYYAQYIPTQQGQYSKENIDKEKQKLLLRLDKTIFSINQES